MPVTYVVVCAARMPPDHRDLWIREHDAETRAAESGVHDRKTRRVVTRDAPFIGSFVQQRNLVVGVSGDEDRRRTALHRLAIEDRDAARVERDRRVLEPEVAHVGRTSGRGEQVVERFGACFPGEVAVVDDEPVARARHRGARIGVEIKLGAEYAPRFRKHVGVRQRTHAAATAEHLDAYAEPMQRLAEFEADHARAECRHAFRQVRELEHVLVREQPVAEIVPCFRIGGRRAGRDDDGTRVDRRVADCERRVRDEARMAMELVRSGQRIDALRDEADEAVALALHARHYRAAVDRDVAAKAEAREAFDRVGRFRGRDEKLARHAADPRARRPVHAALDQQRGTAGRLRRTVSREARGSGADHRNVRRHFAHHDSLHATRAGRDRGRAPRVGNKKSRRGLRAGKEAYAALRRYASSSFAPPIRRPLTKTCGTVAAPAIAPTALVRIACGSGTSA